MTIFANAFWKRAAERAIKSAAQAAVLGLGADQINAFNVSWGEVGGLAVGGAVLSFLTSLLTAGVGPDNDPSAV